MLFATPHRFSRFDTRRAAKERSYARVDNAMFAAHQDPRAIVMQNDAQDDIVASKTIRAIMMRKP